MSSDLAIRVEGLSKCYHIYDKPRDRLAQMLSWGRRRFYREFWALKDVSFEIRKGETVGIIGRNGSGKSTLLQLICGTLAQTTGAIHTHGRVAALLELGSGFNPEFTGRENVYLNASILGLTPQEIDEKYPDIAAFAGIGDFIERPVKSYSSGMMVRLAFAVAINSAPDILVIDEALSVGDELFQRKCFSKIQDHRDRGASVLFVSHSPVQVVELCERVVLLDQGELLAVGPPKRTVGLYQKMIYAPAEKKEAVRREIIEAGHEPEKWSRGENERPAQAVPDDADRQDAEEFMEEMFDPSLIPENTIKYVSRGVHISRPEIFNSRGVAVNNLVRGRTYNYVYKVAFQEAATRVRFGFAIRKQTGLVLGGSVSAPAHRASLDLAMPGDVYEVSFAFNCNFNAGVYHMNVGIFGQAHGEETVLNRLVDVIAFRVLPSAENIESATVFLSSHATVRALDRADGAFVS